MTPELAKNISDRHTGIGCDQILLFKSIDDEHNIFDFQIYNTDGSQSQQCGNGASCTAKLVYDLKYTAGDPSLILRTAVDDLRCTVLDEQLVTTALGIPKFSPDDVPFTTDLQEVVYPLTDVEVAWKPLEISTLSIGNPHAVTRVGECRILSGAGSRQEGGSSLEISPKNEC